MNLKTKPIFCIVLIMLLSRCANEMAPTGGVQDKEPPKYISAKPDNESLRFTGKSVKIRFNEFLDYAINPGEIQVTPEMEKPPMFYVENKTLNIIFKEQLKQNTTYNFQFGNCIKDITEKNVLQNFSYCFSTGDSLDKCFLSGKVQDITTLKSAEEYVVGIYTDSNYTKKPHYYCKTNKDGSFQFKNIKSGKYDLIAFEDKNGSKIYENISDGNVGFHSEKLELRDTITGIALNVFPNKKNPIDNIGTKGDSYIISLSSPTSYYTLEADSDILIQNQSMSETHDSIYFWLKGTKDSFKLSINFIDTTVIKKLKAVYTKDTLTLADQLVTTISPLEDLYLFGNHPLKTLMPENVTIYEDSLIAVGSDKIKGVIENKKAKLSFPKKDNKAYYIILGDNAVTDIFGNANKKGSIKIKTGLEKDYGNLIVKYSSEKNNQVIIELLNDKGSVINRKIISENKSSFSFNNLTKGTYKLTAVYDTNNNGHWDSGNFEKKIHPEERLLIKENIEIKGGWDIDLEIKM